MDTESLRRALARGGTVTLPPGVFRVGPLEFPPAPRGASLVGAGMGATVLEPLDPGRPLLSSGGRRASGGRLADLTLRAPAGARGATAVDLSACSATDLERVQFEGPWEVGVLLRSLPGLGCYGNVLRRLKVERNVGPRFLVLCRNSGDALTTPHANSIEHLWVYGVRGCEAVLDLADSTLIRVVGGVIESVPGAAAVVPGNCTTVEGLWIEGTAAPVRPAVGRGLTPNWLTLRDDYLSPRAPVPMPAQVRGWKIEGTSEAMVAFEREPVRPRD